MRKETLNGGAQMKFRLTNQLSDYQMGLLLDESKFQDIFDKTIHKVNHEQKIDLFEVWLSWIEIG